MGKIIKNALSSRFNKASDAVRNRIIGLSVGEEGTGKTSFWLGAPGPIVVLSFDKGLEGVIEEYQDDKDIYVKEYDWMPTDETGQEEAVAVRDEFTEDFEQALQHARTLIIDKETNMWEMFRYAHFGDKSGAQLGYAPLNQRVRRLLNMPKATNINFGIIEGMRDRWVTKAKSDGSGTKGFNTGERIRQGFDEAGEIVHMTLKHERRNGEFFYYVGKSRGPGSRTVQDNEFQMTEPKDAFTEFAMNVFPGTSEEDWK